MKKTLGLAIGLVCAAAAMPVSAGEMKAYNASFCHPSVDYAEYYSAVYFYRADNAHTAVCPVLRDQENTTDLPRIYMEVRQSSSSDNDLGCSVWWMNEDASSGGTLTIRGSSTFVSTSGTGARQLAFNSLSVYQGSGTTSLTSGNEGTMGIRCNLEPGDYINQYRVEENMF